MASQSNWRKGDKSEYLAQVFLSSHCFSNPVYRQEDYGIDFTCSLIEKVGKNLYPSETFNVQCKSGGSRKLKYELNLEESIQKYLCRSIAHNQNKFAAIKNNLDI